MENWTEEQLEELSSQLSCPSGETGIEVAENMHQSNIGMTSSTIEALSISSNDVVLELGHGSAAHLPSILSIADGIRYQGLEISEQMQKEAQRINAQYYAANPNAFLLYDGLSTPFTDNTFDKILTVNTIYFWQKPEKLLQELHRVLKPKGTIAIAFAQKQFMEHLPFVKHQFTLYDEEDIKALVEKTDLFIERIVHKTEKVSNKIGESVERNYSIALLSK